MGSVSLCGVYELSPEDFELDVLLVGSGGKERLPINAEPVDSGGEGCGLKCRLSAEGFQAREEP